MEKERLLREIPMDIVTLSLVSVLISVIVASVYFKFLASKKVVEDSLSNSRFTPLEAQDFRLKRREIFPESRGESISDSSRIELYSKILSLASSKFRSHSSAILYANEYGEIFVIGPQTGSRLEELVKHFFRPFFALGHQDSFGFQETFNTDGALSQFYPLGFRYIVSEPIKDEETSAVLWLGFRGPPEPSLLGGIKSFTLELARELPSYRHYYGLAEKITKVENANRLKSEAIAHVSHDIRSPLNNIKSILSLLGEEGSPKDLVDVALKNCESVSEIVESMLDYSLHQAGKLSCKAENLDLNSIVRDVASTYEVEARMKGLNFKILDQSNSILVRADKRHLKRILGNLISNAVKYTLQGSIKISCGIDGTETAYFNVADTGVGLSEAQISQLFTPYTRFESKGIEGIGLGLALSQVLASLNEGSISVSSNQGKGATFKLSLQLAKEGEKCREEAKNTSKQPLIRGKVKVLLVDDDEDLVFSLARVLRGNGIETITSVTVRDALSIINFEKPDVIITDASMPDGGAAKILKFASKLVSSINVAILTGHDAGETERSFYELGAAKVFLKPADNSEIRGWIFESTRPAKALVA